MINKSPVSSTKADTLLKLKNMVKNSKIVRGLSFNFYEWKNHEEKILDGVQKEFNPRRIIIRSSAVGEDTKEWSMAGQFESVLGVDSRKREEIRSSVNKVFGSYKKKGSIKFMNQVLVQFQVEDILLSGVVFTRGLQNNSPYYIINYDSKGSTNSVTSGIEGRTVKISRFLPEEEIPEKFRKLILAIKETERLMPNNGLDIEFGINKKKEVIIFQVRPITTKKTGIYEEVIKRRLKSLEDKFRLIEKANQRVSGEKKIFADMPDWNPAEIIGDSPGYLDFSLYNNILMESAWHEARISQGYDAGTPSRLVVLFGNKPYVDVGSTFSSFIPGGLSKELRRKLILFYMNKLRKNPELQDKVEFDILHTCYDLRFKERSKEFLENGFNEKEIDELKSALINLTNNLVVNSKKNIKNDLKSLEKMKKNRKKIKISDQDEHVFSSLKCAKLLLNDCRKFGTVQFSRLARLAFIGKILLKSLVQKEIISADFYDSFMESIRTVATEFEEDFELMSGGRLSKEKFIRKYYHLRPGTYDITSKRYESNLDLIKSGGDINFKIERKKGFALDKEIAKKIKEELMKEGLKFNSKELFTFIRSSIESREFSKFEFTKNLSDAIELIAIAGEEMGFSREEMAILKIEDILAIEDLDRERIGNLWKRKIIERGFLREIDSHLELPPILFSVKDFYFVRYNSSRPNYITSKEVTARLYDINKADSRPSEIRGKIVMIENGDPGYDWIFTKGPAGLITKYGGVASHMSIRCAEFGIPAAIGCGILFDKLKDKGRINLDCKLKKIVPLEIE